jgi:conserved hypothetical protein TIGR00149
MEIHRTAIHCQTSDNTDVIDITPQVTEALRSSGIKEGVVFLFVSGSTAALTTIEYEQGVVNDLIRTIEKIAPQNISYQHNLRWGDGNGYSHVRASLLGPSLNIPVTNKKIAGRSMAANRPPRFLINRPREREVVVQIIGN